MAETKEFTAWLVERGYIHEVETMYDNWYAGQWAAHGPDYLAWCEANGFEAENLDGV